MALLLTIVFSCTTEKDLPGSNIKNERKAMTLTFRDNNSANRIKLFQYPLIRFLWEHWYISECFEEIGTYMRFVKSQDQGEKKCTRLLEEVAQIESIFSFNMLPTSFKNESALRALTE